MHDLTHSLHDAKPTAMQIIHYERMRALAFEPCRLSAGEPIPSLACDDSSGTLAPPTQVGGLDSWLRLHAGGQLASNVGRSWSPFYDRAAKSHDHNENGNNNTPGRLSLCVTDSWKVSAVLSLSLLSWAIHEFWRMHKLTERLSPAQMDSRTQ